MKNIIYIAIGGGIAYYLYLNIEKKKAVYNSKQITNYK